MSVLSRIQRAIVEGRYELRGHALAEAQADWFAPSDVRHAMLQGTLVKRYTRDPRGTRYKILGPALDARLMYVVCRFTELGIVKVITVYEA